MRYPIVVNLAPQPGWPSELQRVQPWWKPQPVGLTPQERHALEQGQLPEGFSAHALRTGRAWGKVGPPLLIIGLLMAAGAAAMGYFAYQAHDGERLGQALMLGVFGVPAIIFGLAFLRTGRATPGRVQQARVLCRVGVLRRKTVLVPRGGSLVVDANGYALDVDGLVVKMVMGARAVFDRLHEGARYRVFHLGDPFPLLVWIEEA